jgi:HSP20 family protein
MGIRYRDDGDDLTALRDRIVRYFLDRHDSIFGQYGWSPAVDIYETEHRFIVNAELPGVKWHDMDVRINDNVLTIKGERKLSVEVEREYFHRMERNEGGFLRSFLIPGTIDYENMEAVLRHGVLIVTIPKKASCASCVTTPGEMPPR